MAFRRKRRPIRKRKSMKRRFKRRGVTAQRIGYRW